MMVNTVIIRFFLTNVQNSPSLLGEGDAASQMMSWWKSESLCGDSPVKSADALEPKILVGVLKSSRGKTEILITKLVQSKLLICSAL